MRARCVNKTTDRLDLMHNNFLLLKTTLKYQDCVFVQGFNPVLDLVQQFRSDTIGWMKRRYCTNEGKLSHFIRTPLVHFDDIGIVAEELVDPSSQRSNSFSIRGDCFRVELNDVNSRSRVRGPRGYYFRGLVTGIDLAVPKLQEIRMSAARV